MSKLLELLISKKKTLEKRILSYPLRKNTTLTDFDFISLQIELEETNKKIEKTKKRENHQKELDRENRLFEEQPLKPQTPNLFMVYLLLLLNKQSEHKLFLAIALTIFLGDSNEQKYKP